MQIHWIQLITQLDFLFHYQESDECLMPFFVSLKLPASLLRNMKYFLFLDKLVFLYTLNIWYYSVAFKCFSLAECLFFHCCQ